MQLTKSNAAETTSQRLCSRERNRNACSQNEISTPLFAKTKPQRGYLRRRNRNAACSQNEIATPLFAKTKSQRRCSRKRNRTPLFAKTKSQRRCSRKRNRNAAVCENEIATLFARTKSQRCCENEIATPLFAKTKLLDCTLVHQRALS